MKHKQICHTHLQTTGISQSRLMTLWDTHTRLPNVTNCWKKTWVWRWLISMCTHKHVHANFILRNAPCLQQVSLLYLSHSSLPLFQACPRFSFSPLQGSDTQEQRGAPHTNDTTHTHTHFFFLLPISPLISRTNVYIILRLFLRTLLEQIHDRYH